MRRTTFRTLATTTATLTLAATAFTAQAASPTPDAEEPLGEADLAEKYPVELLEAMQDDLDVTEDRAVERLDFQADASDTLDELDAALGDDFAGMWIDAEDDVVYAAVTDTSQVPTVRRAGARAVTARYSLEDLEQWQSSLTAPLSDVDGVSGTYVDLAENTIVVQVHRGSRGEARQAARAAGVPQRAVTFERTTEEPRTYQDVVGGNAYYIGGGSRCSVGFAVTTGFVTAGHCGSTGATTSQPSGTFAGSVFPGSDMAHVRTAAGNTPVGAVNDYAGGVVAVAGSAQAPVGSQVCRSGSTTGWHCGTIQAYNATVTYPQGSVNGLIRTTVCAEPGDSGGSLLAGDQAQGVTSGGSGNCSSGGTTFFQPVNPILNRYDLTLVTNGGGEGGGEDPSCTGTSYSSDGSLSQGGQAVHPDGSYWNQSGSAQIAACVEGPSSGDFDVYLQRWTGSSWSTVAQGSTTSSLDSLTYSASSGYYRVVVHAYSGSGAYTTGITVS
ncbi:streptogrisin C [Isoptericola sp. CG 20/1183]|uniref:Streptogrisin C n=1 Tax=Isoptericola halotolerans TaxID=300560 RepID=A0ABX5EMX4_9MICO|nr:MULTISPECIES: S1 family peptidase [Isoptericola]PRZ09703.1 streptogrisin C [Isoptericola sp. CG 20/1183]PRZ10504.1 streptogrisin C [Isoptericola halotolerans]